MLNAGVELYALSYDEPDALIDFSEAYGITFPMLSDPDSTVIESFGILNTLIPPDDHPWYGIPFPGTYLIDAGGTITHKFFEHSLAVRVGPEQLLAAATGRQVQVEPAGTQSVDEVSVDVEIEGRDLPPGLQRDVVARFTVPAGQHVYGEPVPDGMVAAAIEIDDQRGLMVAETVEPPTRPLVLSGTGETLHVFDGDVALRRPITHNGTAGVDADGHRIIRVTGEVRWQACDDEQCGLPRRERFEVEIPVGRILPSVIRPPADGEIAPMDGAKHLARMVERRRTDTS